LRTSSRASYSSANSVAVVSGSASAQQQSRRGLPLSAHRVPIRQRSHVVAGILARANDCAVSVFHHAGELVIPAWLHGRARVRLEALRRTCSTGGLHFGHGIPGAPHLQPFGPPHGRLRWCSQIHWAPPHRRQGGFAFPFMAPR
jgi:hypothetical protein